jgi:hypothetical protein
MSQAGLVHITDSVLPPDVPLIFQGNAGSGSAVANIFEILGGTGVTTAVVGNVMTITIMSSGFTWNVVTSVAPANPIIFATENGYITKGLALVSFSLPASAAIGDTYRLVGYNALWTVAQNANQTITLGIKTTTSGVGGSIAATGVNDTIEMVCVTANLEWIITDVTGNITFI